MPLTPRSILAAGFALAAAAHAQNTWTVDDNGAADFSSIQSAISGVAPGDILLIKTGTYGAALVNKPLTLLGDPSQPRPKFASLDFLNIARFDAAHLEAPILAATNIASHASLDDVVVTSAETHLENCADMSITNSSFAVPTSSVQGLNAMSLGNCGYVQIVRCTLQGGAGTSDSTFFLPGNGGHGLDLVSSTALVVASTVRGGAGQNLTIPIPLPGKGGDGIRSGAGSRVEVRGSSTHVLAGGPNHAGQAQGQPTGFALRAIDGGTGIASGVTATGGFNGPVTQPAARPYLEWSGSGGLGSSRQAKLYGSAGSPGAIFLATGAFLDFGFEPLYGLPLLVHPGTIFLSNALVTLGQNNGIGPTYMLPFTSTLAGQVFYAQAGVLSGSSIVATNAAQLVLSF